MISNSLMRVRVPARFITVSLILLSGTFAFGQRPSQVVERPVVGDHMRLPMGFEKYVGQSNVDFVAQSPGYSVYLSRGEVIVSFGSRAGESVPPELVRISFAGTNKQSQASAEDPLPGVIHYYIGNDPSLWRTNVQRFRRVRYRELYPGIGLLFYCGRQVDGRQELEFDFEVSPGHEVSAISMKFQGAAARKVDGGVELVTPQGRVALLKNPELYQLRQGKRETVSGWYVEREGGEIGFAVADYDRNLPLIIDPALAYSTLIQRLLELTLFPGQFPPGTEIFEGDNVSGIAADGSGAAYITGSAFVPDPSFGFLPGPPIVPASNVTVSEAFVVKLDPTGSNLVYTAYLGGNSSTITSSGARSIALDASANAYIVGTTDSPTFVTTPGVFNRTPVCPTETRSNKNCSELFAAKLDSTGHLVFATFLVNGGSTDTAGPSLGSQRIGVDVAGGIYVAGNIEPAGFVVPKDPAPPSVAGLNVTPGAFQAIRKSNFSGYVLKLHADGSALDYSTYLGGSTTEQVGGVVADATGVAYVAGETFSADFPTTAGAFQTTNSGTSAFFTKMKTDGSGLLYSTFLGAAGINSQANGIAIDATNNAFLAGSTTGPGFPTTAGAFKTNVIGAGGFNFVSEFDTAGNLVFSTYIGDNANTTGIAVDGTGVYVAGLTSSANYPLLNSIEPPPLPGEVPMYVTKLNLTGSALVYSTLVGNSLANGVFSIGNPGISGMALDGSQNVYLAGTPSDVFPTTVGAFQPLPQTITLAARAGFVTKVAPSLGAPVAVVTPRVFAFPNPLQQGVPSAPLSVKLSDYGDADLSVASIAITGTNASDFSQSNNCPATVLAGRNCTVTVIFTPTVASGTRVANLQVTFGGGLPAQTVALTGMAGTPIFRITPTPGDFGTIGTLEDSVKSFTITNTGTGPLTMSNVTFIPTGNFPSTDFSFGPTNAGPPATLLQPGQSTSFHIWMHVGLDFGNLTAQFRVDDNSPGSPHIFQLTGFGFHTTPDFAMSMPDGAAATATVTAGQTATYNVIVASIPGFGLGGGAISISCSGAPPGARCNTSTASLPLPDNNPETVVVSVSTTAATASLRPARPVLWWPVVALAGIFCIRSRRNRSGKLLLTACLLIVACVLTSCGGGGGTGSSPGVPTPPGTYTLTFTASSGTVTHTFPLTLVVK